MIFPALLAALDHRRPAACPPTRAASSTSRSTSGPAAVLDRFHPADRRSARPPTPRCGNCPPTCTARWRRTIRPWCAVRATIRARSSPASARRPIQLCRDPKGYVPIGSNPWRGPPVPDGTHDRSSRRAEHPAAQQVPVHPAGCGFRPGAAGRCSCRRASRRVRDLRRNAPFPLPVPPNDNGPPPPPWPFFAPPDQIVPPYGRTPPGSRLRRRDPPRRRCLRRCCAPLPAEAPTAGQRSGHGDVRPERRVRRPGGRNWRLRPGLGQTGARGELGRSDDGSEAGMTEVRHGFGRIRDECRAGAARPSAGIARSAGPRPVPRRRVQRTTAASSAGRRAKPGQHGPSARRRGGSRTGGSSRSGAARDCGRGVAAGRLAGVLLLVAAARRRGGGRRGTNGSSTPPRRRWSTCSATTRTPSTRA